MFDDTMFRGLYARAMTKFEQALAGRSEMDKYIGMIQGSMVSTALSHACYPKGSFGSKEGDDLLQMIRQSSFKPIDVTRSCYLVEAWIDRNEVSMEDAFRQIWGTEYMVFLNAVFNKGKNGN